MSVDGDVLPVRTKSVALGHEGARTQFLVDLLSASNAASTPHRRKLKYQVAGRALCQEGFRRALGISRKKLRRAIESFRRGLLPPAHTRAHVDHPNLKSDAVFGWLSQYFDSVCDDVPTADGVHRVMTFWRSWPGIHALFAAQFKAEHAQSPLRFKPPSFPVFERVRLEHFGSVKRPTKGSQPSCTVCIAISSELERGDERNRAALLRQLREHSERHQRQRRDTQAEIDAELASGKALVVRFDYMSGAQVPHYRRPPKVNFALCCCARALAVLIRSLQTLARKQPLDIRIGGAYVQGSDQQHNGLYLVMQLTSVLKDGNTVATLLHEIVSHARLPDHEHLVLSFDNAVAEGKNIVIIALAVLWVSLGWFARVRILNLLPGHTHNFLDALFSHVQRAVCSCTIASMADVASAMATAFTSPALQPKVLVLHRSWDWRALFEGKLEPMAGHSVPLSFSIEKVPSLPASTPARVMVRDLSSDPWYGLERTDRPIDVLDRLPRGSLHSVPLNPLARSLDSAQLQDCVRTALRHQLLHGPEADELLRIIEQGTSGAMQTSAAEDGHAGKPAYLQRPGTDDRVAVRLIASPPTSLQPPPSPSSAARGAAQRPAPPPVPLFHKPRVSVITHRKHKLKPLREAAEREQSERKAAPASGSGSASTAAVPAATSSAACVRSSPRRQSPSPSPAPSPKPPMVSWDQIDDEMDEDYEG